MSKRALTLMLLCAILALPTLAQGRKNVRINEIMVQQDTTGGNGWVEFYNSSYGTNAVEKMFITTLSREEIQNVFDKNKGTNKKPNQVLLELCEARPMDIYEIPRGDERNTKIAPRTHFVMEADGDPKSGTFHMPFTFTAGKDNYIALYDVNGDLVDDVTIPATLKPGESYAIKAEGRLPSILDDGKTEWTIKDGKTIETAITKGNYNIREVNENIEAFHIKDPHGYWIAILAMTVVFGALAILYICFKLFGVVSKSSSGKEDATTSAPAAQAATMPAASGDLDGEKMAAICFALYQHLNAHDQESGVLTLTSRDGSAWSGKAGLMRELPVIKK